jgi:hypothetical protein
MDDVRKTTEYYVKLQQAYVSEAASFGGWQKIGYTGPGASQQGANGSTSTTNFLYEGSFSVTAASITPAGNAYGWKAKNITKLNDCAPGYNWTVALTAIQDGQETMTTQVQNGGGCDALTPNFDAIDGVK